MRPVFARARRILLALPGTSETLSHGHPVFRAGPKLFCAFEVHWGRPSIAVRVPFAEFDAQVKTGRMFATPYGRGAWTSIWVAGGHAKEGAKTSQADGEVNWKELTALIARAYAGVAKQR